MISMVCRDCLQTFLGTHPLEFCNKCRMLKQLEDRINGLTANQDPLNANCRRCRADIFGLTAAHCTVCQDILAMEQVDRSKEGEVKSSEIKEVMQWIKEVNTLQYQHLDARLRIIEGIVKEIHSKVKKLS